MAGSEGSEGSTRGGLDALRRGFWRRDLRLSCVLRALRALIAPASRKSQHRWPGIDRKHTASTHRRWRDANQQRQCPEGSRIRKADRR